MRACDAAAGDPGGAGANGARLRHQRGERGERNRLNDRARIEFYVAHALGGGIRLDMAVFSFIERATLRFDVGKTINAASPFQFWFGVQQPF